MIDVTSARRRNNSRLKNGKHEAILHLLKVRSNDACKKEFAEFNGCWGKKGCNSNN
jgi:hypothetical protein